MEDFGKEELDVETPENLLDEDDCDEIPPHLSDHMNIENDHYEKYIDSDVLLPLGECFKNGCVTSRKMNADGKVIEIENLNPTLDSRENIVEFPDGAKAGYSTNVITESIYA